MRIELNLPFKNFDTLNHGHFKTDNDNILFNIGYLRQSLIKLSDYVWMHAVEAARHKSCALLRGFPGII